MLWGWELCSIYNAWRTCLSKWLNRTGMNPPYWDYSMDVNVGMILALGFHCWKEIAQKLWANCKSTGSGISYWWVKTQTVIIWQWRQANSFGIIFGEISINPCVVFLKYFLLLCKSWVWCEGTFQFPTYHVLMPGQEPFASLLSALDASLLTGSETDTDSTASHYQLCYGCMTDAPEVLIRWNEKMTEIRVKIMRNFSPFLANFSLILVVFFFLFICLFTCLHVKMQFSDCTNIRLVYHNYKNHLTIYCLSMIMPRISFLPTMIAPRSKWGG